jgi:hypothetical protein
MIDRKGVGDNSPFRGRRFSRPLRPLRGNLGSPLLAPSAPSGGTWGDASPQTPAKQTVWLIVEQVLVSESALANAAGVTDRRGA